MTNTCMNLKISGWNRGIKKTPLLRFSCSLQDEPYVFVISHITTKQERPSDPPLEKIPGSAHDFWFTPYRFIYHCAIQKWRSPNLHKHCSRYWYFLNVPLCKTDLNWKFPFYIEGQLIWYIKIVFERVKNKTSFYSININHTLRIYFNEFSIS